MIARPPARWHGVNIDSRVQLVERTLLTLDLDLALVLPEPVRCRRLACMRTHSSAVLPNAFA